MLTRVDEFDGWWAKREDLACWERPDWPSGAKVRQYLNMCAAQPGAPLIVGCAAFSAMQIYIAAAAEKFGVPGIIYIPGRRLGSDATRYAYNKNIEINELRPCGGPNVYRARARERGKLLGRYVKWDFMGALHDARAQTANIPTGVKRVVIPTGSGLIAAGVLAGLVGRDITVVAIATSAMADKSKILTNAAKVAGENSQLPPFMLLRAPGKYEQYAVASLPDGTPLDPFYSAKAMPYIKPGDCLWPVGLHPVCSMPVECRDQFRGWQPNEVICNVPAT